MFLSTMQTLPFEGHNVAYQCTGLDLSNNVREYEVNRLTNEKTTLTQIVNAAVQPPARTDSPIFKQRFSSKNPANDSCQRNCLKINVMMHFTLHCVVWMISFIKFFH